MTGREPSSALPPRDPAPEWLVRSCPSVADARRYRPPSRHAWCVECGDVRPCDSEGCLACRGAR